MAVGRFTEETHPELMSIPLKGEMLREFVRLVRDGSDGKKLGMREDAPIFEIGGMQAMFDAMQKIGDAFVGALDSDAARKHGIDAHDMESIIRRAIKQDVGSIDVREAIDRAFEGIKIDEEKITLEPNEEAMAQAIAPIIMGNFSMCLAVQEHKEEAFLRLVDEGMKESNQKISEARFNDDFGPEFIQGFLAAFGINVVSTEQALALAKARKSPVVPLLEQASYGRDYPKTRKKTGMYELLDNAIEIFLDVDGATAAGKETIRETRKEILDEMRQIMGIDSKSVA